MNERLRPAMIELARYDLESVTELDNRQAQAPEHEEEYVLQ